MIGRALSVCLLPVALVASSCTRAVDIKQTFRVVELQGGWYDAGIVDGKNKLVPSVTFTVEKTTGEAVPPLSLNVLFKKAVGQTEELWDEVFLQRVEFTEGNRTPPMPVRPQAGFTADPPQTRAEMLKHSQFADVRVVIFAKQSSSNWVELAQYDVPRQVLTQ